MMEYVTTQRILVIEDDQDIANVLRMDLTDAGYDVEHADSAMNGLIKAREEHPTLILLDLGLPDFDGGDVVQRLRKNSAVPIIVLTARDTVEEKVRLLGLGADDYLIKPFHPDELLARVKVQLRQRTTESLTMGDLTLDPQKRLVTYKAEGTTMNMSTPIGESYAAKTDGTDAPFKGDPGTTTVAVKIRKNTLEETFKRDGKAIGMSRMEVDASGKKAKVDWIDNLTKTNGNYVMAKQ